MRDIVLFLGAGFSADADLPVMGEFRESADIEWRDVKEHLSEGAAGRKMAKEFEQSAEVWNAFRQLCVEQGAVRGDDEDNIEALFCVAEAFRSAGGPPLELKGRSYTGQEIADWIELWTWKVYHQLPLFNPGKRDPKPGTYERFFDAVGDAELAARATVVTTNYDIVFEWTSFSSKTAICSYPLASARTVQAGTGSETYVKVGEAAPDSIPVLKLHGSVNYFRTSPNASEVLVPTNVGDGARSEDVVFPKGLPAVSSFDSVAYLRRVTGSDQLLPVIVPPTYAKVIKSPWQKSAWKAAFEALRTASGMIFIGYSLPPTDGFMRSMLSAALVARGERPPPLVFVVARSDTTHCRFREVYGAGGVEKTDQLWLGEATERLIPDAMERIQSVGRR
jgi:hypothetical protein